MSPLELEIYERCLLDAVNDEFTPRAERALATGAAGMPGD
jgi:hypothetical protein